MVVDMNDCFVSICIPAYKEVDLLERAIKSCLHQTFENFEIIVSDDTQDDSICKFVKKVSEHDFRVKYFRNPGPHGAAANSNYAVNMAKGEWIKFLYQDDEFTQTTSLENFVQKTHQADFIFSSCYQVKSDSKTIHSIKGEVYEKIKTNPVQELIESGNVIGAPSVTMIKKNIYQPFEEDMVWKFDLFMYLKFMVAGTSFYYIEDPQVNIHEHGNQLTCRVGRSSEINYRESLRILLFLMGHFRYSVFSLGKVFRLIKTYHFPWLPI